MLKPTRDREQVRDRIAGYCRRLMLSKEIVTYCEQMATPRQEEFLCQILADELARRELSKKTRLLKRACFPVYKSFADYEFQCVRMPPTLSQEELLSCQFIGEKKNLVLYGPVGLGKTHMAVALGVRACEMGLNVRFYTVTQLVLKLTEARRNGTLERLINELQRLNLLLLDEWGYVPIDKDGSQLLFRVVSDSYESKSLILTTNLEFSRWGSIFTDEQMAAAMIDRLIHHGHLIMFEGKSYRMEHALMRQVGRKSAAVAVQA